MEEGAGKLRGGGEDIQITEFTLGLNGSKV